MNISAFELRFQFTEDTRLRTPIKIVSELLGEEISEEIEPVILRKEREKFAVMWSYDGFGVLKEDIGSVQACINKFLKTTESINKVAPMGNLSKRSLTIDWIFPVDNKYNFRQLEIEYRKILINDNKLVKGVLDSSLVLDIRCEQGILHHQSGAMRISQLQDEYRAFKTREGHPMIFLFLQTDVENRQLMTYSKKDIEDFMRKSYEVCKSHTTRFKKIMGAVL